jgi:GTP-binding protein
MKIVSAVCVASAVGPKQYPAKALPEVAFVGRSNVGKSSLINSMCSRRGLARTSGQPGKTQTINFFEINERLYFVDLPGYGYAETSRDKRREWGGFITDYLSKSERLVLVIQLIDMRHAPMKNDIEASKWLSGLGVPYIIVATKADKIARGRHAAHLAAIRKGLGLAPGAGSLVYSSESGEGRDALWRNIMDVLGRSA